MTMVRFAIVFFAIWGVVYLTIPVLIRLGIPFEGRALFLASLPFIGYAIAPFLSGKSKR